MSAKATIIFQKDHKQAINFFLKMKRTVKQGNKELFLNHHIITHNIVNPILHFNLKHSNIKIKCRIKLII